MHIAELLKHKSLNLFNSLGSVVLVAIFATSN